MITVTRTLSDLLREEFEQESSELKALLEGNSVRSSSTQIEMVEINDHRLRIAVGKVETILQEIRRLGG